MREDTGIEQGDEISVYYDPMISKLISHSNDRNSAIEKNEKSFEGI
jgi:acetyl/propionyl-CoA carboxylase alpha subunit